MSEPSCRQDHSSTLPLVDMAVEDIATSSMTHGIGRYVVQAAFQIDAGDFALRSAAAAAWPPLLQYLVVTQPSGLHSSPPESELVCASRPLATCTASQLASHGNEDRPLYNTSRLSVPYRMLVIRYKEGVRKAHDQSKRNKVTFRFHPQRCHAGRSRVMRRSLRRLSQSFNPFNQNSCYLEKRSCRGASLNRANQFLCVRASSPSFESNRPWPS